MLTGWMRGGLNNARDYGTSSHPGSVDFEEEALHGTCDELTFFEQAQQLFRLLPRVKAQLLWLLPVLALLIGFAPVSSAPPLVSVAISVLSLLVMVPCQVTLTECLEDIVVRYDSDMLGVVVNVFVENASLTFFSIFSVIYGTRHALCFVKSTILGCVLFNILVVFGTAVFISSGDDAGEGALSLRTWSAFGSGLLLSTTVFLMPTLYDLTVGGPDTLTRLARNQTTTEAAIKAQINHSLLLSRVLCTIMLIAYVLYILHMLRTHYNYFSAAGNPNSPSSLSYALLYREQAILAATSAVAGYRMSSGAGAPGSVGTGVHPNRQAADTGGVFISHGRSRSAGHEGLLSGPRFSKSFATWASIALCVMLAAMSECFVVALPGTLRALPWLSQPFLVVVILPIVFSISNLGASTLISQMGRLDISVSIAFSSIVHIFCCISPAIVLVAWMLGRPLELTFHPFLAAMCFVSVLATTQLVVWNRAGQLEGSTLLTIYLLVAVVCALGGWHMCSM